LPARLSLRDHHSFPTRRSSDLGATRVDPQDRIWLLERADVSKRAGLIYDVIDRSGQIVDRVQMPPNAAVIGFGPKNAVYLSITPDRKSTRLNSSHDQISYAVFC